VRERLARELQGDFNSVLANLYRNGADAWASIATANPSSDPSR
jgi:hypothetical protein